MKLPKKSDALVGEDKSLEDDEENFLNPEDLSIIDEKTWEPSDEEILSYALKLGYDIEKDPDELFEVAYYYMKYPLPEGWKRAIYKKTKELMYINMEDGEIEVATEIEEMAHQKNGLFLCNAKWHTITLQLDLAIEGDIVTNN